MSACASCGAAIRWERTQSGKRIPLDMHPTNRGNIALDASGVACVVDPERLPAGTPRYTSHFATCPDAEGWRR